METSNFAEEQKNIELPYMVSNMRKVRNQKRFMEAYLALKIAE